MKFYRDLFEASLNRVVPEHDKQRFFEAFYTTFIHMSAETEQHFSQRSGEEGQQMIFKAFSPCWRSTATSLYPISGTAGAGAERGRPASAAAFLPCGGKRCSKPSAPAIRCAMRRSSPHGHGHRPGLEYLRRRAELHYQTAGQ